MRTYKCTSCNAEWKSRHPGDHERTCRKCGSVARIEPQKGDRLKSVDPDDLSDDWGIVEYMDGNICFFRFADEARQAEYWAKYRELPCFIWWFNREREYNRNIKLA